MKAQSLSVTTIIILVLGLIVLVVIASAVNSRMGLFAVGTQACKKQGGECFSATCPVEMPIELDGKCEIQDEAPQVCCTG